MGCALKSLRFNVASKIVLVLALLLFAVFVPRATFAQQRGLITETFANPTTVPNQFVSGGTGCLTAGSTATTIPGSIPPCATNALDPAGAGVLRLTTTRNNDAGNAIYEPTLQSTSGLVVTFDMFIYGGDNADGSGADGIAFFFLDGTKPLPSGPGQPGGSLGYAQDCNGKPGILGGYIGLGLDEWGNFSNPSDRCKVGGPGFIPNTIAIRGSEASQYRYVTGYGAPNPTGLPFPLSKEVPTRTTPVRVRITLTPSLFVSVELDPTGTGNNFVSYISALSIGNVNGGAFPPSFRFGWAASTGGHTNYHEIRNVTVTTAPPVLAIAKSHSGTFAAGGTGTYAIAVSNVGPVSTAGTTTVVDTLPAGLTYKSSSGSNWTCSASGQKVTCTTSQSVPGSSSPSGSPYTPLSLVVNIAPGTSGTVTNSATASGGGAQNSPIANDPTQIVIPTLTLTKTSSGNFTVGRSGTFTLTPGNNGGFATSGPITVTDTLPNGLTYASATGTGWTCTASGQVVTCVSSASIAPNGTGTPITLTVNVLADALPSVTNPATATGGGATNTATASVTVPVTGNANLTIQKQHTGDFIVGQQGTFTLNVGNDGNVPTSANVTVTDTLPAGLTYVSATGSGWTCSNAGQIFTCISGAVIGVGATSTPITLITAVGAAAIPSATNTATASGGGAPNTPSAIDVVTVNGVPTLTLTKSHTGNFAVGAQGTFTLVAGNNGTAATSGPISVVDTLPNGLTFVSGTGTNWTCTGAGQTVTCTSAAPIPSGGNASPIALTVAVGAAAIPSAINNAAASGGGAPNIAPATDTVAIDAPFLTLAKHHAADFVVGQPAAYTLTVSNTGPVATQGAITVTDPLPAGLTFVSTAGTGWTCNGAGQNVTCTSTTPIAAGGAGNPITLNVAVAGSAIPGVTNTASASGGLAPNVATASDPTTVRGLAELTLGKSHTGDFTVGGRGAYALSVGNVGTAVTAGTITVADTLPNGLTYVSATGAGWTCSAAGQIVTCTSAQPIAIGGTGAPIALTVAVGAAAVPSVTNVADATGGGASNTATASDTTVVNVPVLAVTKRHAADFFVGSPGLYTLTVSNVGSAPTAGLITVTDPLPAGLTFASATGIGWTCAANGQLVTCTSTTSIGTGATGNPIALTVNVATSAIPSITNVVNATGGGATNTATDSDPTVVRGVPGLTISKSHTGNFGVGKNGVYTIVVGNSGSATTAGTITVTDPLPNGLTFVSGIGNGWVCNAAGQNVTCQSTNPIAAGATGNPIALTVAVGLAAYPSVVNTAAASGGGSPNAPNASDPTNIDAPKLGLTKHHSGDFVVGQNGQYTLIVSNDGDVATSGPITVQDPLPAGLTFVSAAGPGWTCAFAAPNVTCTSPAPIAVGQTGNPITLTVVAAASAIPGVTNTATASGGSATNTATASDPTVIRGLANLTLNKTHTGNFVVGQPGVYTLTAGNSGTTATTGAVTVSDTLPNGLTFVSATGPGWTCSNAGRTVTCVSQTPIAVGGAAAPITLTTNVGAAAIPRVTNVATATGGGASNTATAQDEAAVNIPELALKKTHNGDFAVGQQGTYTLTVTNSGSAATFAPITVTDPLPNGLTFVSATGTGWTCSAAGGNVTCISAAVVAAGAAANPIALVVNVGTAAAPSVTNTATATGGGAPNAANASDLTNVNAPSLAIDKRHTGTFTVGQNGQYTLTVSNKGMTATTGTITVTDPLPAGLTYVSAAGTGWTCAASAGTVACTSATPIAAGAAGNPIVLTVAVAAAAIPEVTNTATASGGGATNKPTASDQTVVAGTPKLTIVKSHAGDFSVGQQGTYTVTVGNTGTGDTIGAIRVVDTVPAGLTYVSATGTGWACSNSAQTITCTSTVLISPTRTGNPITIAVNVLPSAVPSVTNVATASGGGNVGTVTATDTTTVTNAALLTAHKLVNGQASVQVATGTTVSYSVAITNTGGSAAKNVVITDPVPTGITPIASSAQINGSGTGISVTLSGQTLTVTLAAGIPAATTATLTFNATVEAAPNGASLVNIASVAATAVPTVQSTPASIFVGVANTVFDGTTGGASPIAGALVSLVDPATGAPLKLAAPGPPPNATNGNPYTTAADGRYAFGLTPQQFGAAIRARAAVSGGTARYNLLSNANGYLSRKIAAAFTPDPTGTLYTVTLTALDGQQLAIEGGFALVNRPVTLTDVLNLLGNIPMFRTGAIQVQKSADRQSATIGDRVVFTLTFSNLGTSTLTNARVIDTLPNGLAYAPGTGRVDGASVEPKVSGRQLIWILPALAPNDPHKIVYATAVAPGAQAATLTNLVVVAAQQANGSTVSAQATADVQIIAGVFGNSLTITGRVIRDGATGSDRGVPGVRIFMENGMSVITDAEGRFNFAEVRPGLHVLRLDTTTLPEKVHAFDDHDYDSPRSTRRLIHGITDTQLLQDVIFIVRGS